MNRLCISDVKKVYDLHACGKSNRKIATIMKLSKNTVNHYVSLFRQQQNNWRSIKSSLAGTKSKASNFESTKYAALQGFYKLTLEPNHQYDYDVNQFYAKYVDHVAQPYSFTTFRKYIKEWLEKDRKSMNLPGKVMFITIVKDVLHGHIDDEMVMNVVECRLQYSNATYYERIEGITLEYLLKLITRAFAYFKGQARIIRFTNYKITEAKDQIDVRDSLLLDWHILQSGVELKSENENKETLREIKQKIENNILKYDGIVHDEMIDEKRFDQLLHNVTKAAEYDKKVFLHEQSFLGYSQIYATTDYKYKRVKVAENSYFQFEDTYYSVPWKYIGKYIQIGYSRHMMEILVEEYDEHGCFTKVSVRSHVFTIPEPRWVTYPEDLPSQNGIPVRWPGKMKNQIEAICPTGVFILRDIMEAAKYIEESYWQCKFIVEFSSKCSKEIVNQLLQKMYKLGDYRLKRFKEEEAKLLKSKE